MTDLEKFFEHQILMKMFHFQTKFYGAHKASDVYLTKFLANFDQFAEILQGGFGKLDDEKIHIKVKTLTDSTVVEHLDSMIDFLENIGGELVKELAAIRDVMIADIQQLKYLIRDFE